MEQKKCTAFPQQNPAWKIGKKELWLLACGVKVVVTKKKKGGVLAVVVLRQGGLVR